MTMSGTLIIPEGREKYISPMKYLIVTAGVTTLHETPKIELETLQAAVGGYIECPLTFPLSEGRELSVFCNEEGKFNGMTPNIAFPQAADIIYGNVALVACDTDTGESVGLTDVEIARVHITTLSPEDINNYGGPLRHIAAGFRKVDVAPELVTA